MSKENIKITLIGNPGVGKTCIISKYTTNTFDKATLSTTGGSFSIKELVINNNEIQCDIWDTAGQERFRSLGRHFYQDAYIVILVYDITEEITFEDLKNKWYEDLKIYGEKYKVLGVVGNKSDMFDKEKVNEEDAKKFANDIGATFMLVSAKTGNNIDLLFEKLIKTYLGPEFYKNVLETKENKGNISIISHKSFKKRKVRKSFC